MILVLVIIAVSITLINFLDVKKVSAQRIPLLWILWIFPILLILTVCLPVLILPLGISKLYREFIEIVLKIKNGKRFAGLLNGRDAIHTVTETVQNVINSVLIYQCPKTMAAPEFYEILKEKLRETYTLPKFNVTFKQEFGYSYLLKEKSNFNNGFRKMEVINEESYKLCKTELMLLLNEHANLHLPFPWEILVGSQPIEWKHDNYNYYFALCRYHHAIMDGVTLAKLTLASNADKDNTGTSSEYDSKRANVTIKLSKLYIETFLAVILIPSWFVSNFVLKRRDKHMLEGIKLSKQCHYVIGTEDHPGYVEKVERLKSKIPGVSFSAILLTAISASLNEFFIKNSDFTKEVNTVLPLFPDSTELRNLKEVALKDVKLQNNFSTLTLSLPVCISKRPDRFDIINRLDLINKKIKALKASSHYKISRLIEDTVWTYLPQQVLVYLLRLAPYTAILSFLPEIPQVTCFNGTVKISDYLLWSTHGLDIDLNKFVPIVACDVERRRKSLFENLLQR